MYSQIPTGGERCKELGKRFEEMMAKIFPNFIKIQ